MKRARYLLAAALAAAACRESPAEPYTPSGPPPSGLSATLALVPPAPDTPPPTVPEVSGAGDSVVVTATLSGSCGDRSVRAGVVNRALVVTFVDSLPAGRMCALIASRMPFRAVVRPAPRGGYAVAVRARTYLPGGATREVELARRLVALH